MIYALEAKPPIKCAKFNKNNNLRDKTMKATLKNISELKLMAVDLHRVADELIDNLTMAQAYAVKTGDETPEELESEKLGMEKNLRNAIGSLQYIHDKRFSIQRAIEKTQ